LERSLSLGDLLGSPVISEDVDEPRIAAGNGSHQVIAVEVVGLNADERIAVSVRQHLLQGFLEGFGIGVELKHELIRCSLYLN
jgi:hypothetical protein